MSIRPVIKFCSEQFFLYTISKRSYTQDVARGGYVYKQNPITSQFGVDCSLPGKVTYTVILPDICCFNYRAMWQLGP